MGVDLGDLVPRQKATLEDLSGKTFAVDAYNMLYQFLAIIRGPTGAPLMDSQGRVTSHLSGLLYRTTNLAERKIRLVYVFDGIPPTLKEAEIKRRREVKQEAVIKYEKAITRGEIGEAKRFAQATASLKDTMVEDARRLLEYLGVPYVQAPSEGEAQAAFMATRGDVTAAVSQDYDSLLFGAKSLVRNLAITGKRKLPMREAYVQVDPETVMLEETLASLGLNQEQLIDLGILIGTDFNPDGFKGIGPKTALKLLQENQSIEKIAENRANFKPPSNLDRIREIFLNPSVTSNYSLRWNRPRTDALVSFLCGDRDFSEERVRTAVERATVANENESSKQTLESFFGKS
ncbi:MAG TPA: flap endonuclease-1 [Candidatus Bathyarchaeia archaeon]|nr:flap endonuclease-1 [Candidatus Bathyarchaeia archaeon]